MSRTASLTSRECIDQCNNNKLYSNNDHNNEHAYMEDSFCSYILGCCTRSMENLSVSNRVDLYHE